MISPSARAFAIQAHGSQKYGPHPYICHLDQVHQIIHNCYPTDFDLLDASYLHDVLEDTSITQLELAKVFGPRISSLVYAVTDCPGSSRSERKFLTYFKIRQYGQQAVILKVADRLANTKSSIQLQDRRRIKMYQKEFPGFSTALFATGECDYLWDQLRDVSCSAPEMRLR